MALRAMLDTNIVSALMRDPLGPLQRRLESFGVDDVCVSIITTGELYFGLEKTPSSKGVRNLQRVLAGIKIQAFERPADEAYGRIRTHLERTGRPIGPNDIWIAAHALSLGLTLVTANVREFSRVPDLKVENWLD